MAKDTDIPINIPLTIENPRTVVEKCLRAWCAMINIFIPTNNRQDTPSTNLTPFGEKTEMSMAMVIPNRRFSVK
jgi:pentose-5-phosphate-3-epimerase